MSFQKINYVYNRNKTYHTINEYIYISKYKTQIMNQYCVVFAVKFMEYDHYEKQKKIIHNELKILIFKKISIYKYFLTYKGSKYDSISSC